MKLEIILKSRGLHLQLNDTSAEQLLNLAAVSRALDVSYSHLRQLIFKGMSVSDALNYLVNEKKGVNNHAWNPHKFYQEHRDIQRWS